MPESTYEVLYREIIGAGDDTEHSNKASGIVVTLSYWNTLDWKVPSHYLIERKVMLNREFVVDDIQVFRAYLTDHSRYIRKAIADIDQLKELNPECCCLEIVGDNAECPVHGSEK